MQHLLLEVQSARKPPVRNNGNGDPVMRSLAVAATVLALVILSFSPSPAAAQSGTNPHITSVTQVWARPYQTIQISGTGFGSLRPFNGDSAFIAITDLTQNWTAGHTGDAVTLDVTSWSDSLITMTSFGGAYGTGNQSLLAGDVLSIEVWNAQTFAGPAKARATVLANATAVYTFKGQSDATGGAGGLILDSNGNFYGMGGGGVYYNCYYSSCGTVWEVSPASGGTYSDAILYDFLSIADGYQPIGTLTRDSSGNLYGVTAYGGLTTVCFLGCGTLFEISGGVKTLLHTFQYGSGDGIYPGAGLTLDASGNLFGTTGRGGTQDAGTIFELTPNGTGGWNYSIVYNFLGGVADGAEPDSALILDSAGNFYGTTYAGGGTEYCNNYISGCGTVFEFSPASGGGFAEKLLHIFKGTAEGVQPAGVTFDASGKLFGATTYGGPPCSSRYNSGCGVAYALWPQSNGTWTEKTIFYFSNNINNVDGSTYPRGGLAYHKGVFYGYAGGGASGIGSLYTLTPAGASWTEATIYSFGGAGSDGGQPAGAPIFGSDGTLYGVGGGAIFTVP
jgi:uncharacterized repeat protein (TIGR03803 family)